MTSSNPNPDGTAAIDQPVFAATITPHRSLGENGFRIVMTLVCLTCVVSSIPFIVLGAWPVAGFFGLDVLALFVAFKVNFRDARAVEEVVVTPLNVRMRRVTRQKGEQSWSFHTLWTKLERVEDAEFGLQRLAVVSRGQSVTVGSWLSAPERETLGDALGEALAKARRG